MMYEPENRLSDHIMRFESFPPDFVPEEFEYGDETDERLIELLKSGSSSQQNDAFGAIYDRYKMDTWRFIRSREEDLEEAKDIWGAVWHIAVKKLPQFEYRGTSIKSWLITTADNMLKEHWRRRKNQVSLEDIYVHARNYIDRELELDENGSSEQSQDGVSIEIDIVIAQLRQNFSDIEQDIIDLFYFKGLDCNKIGEALNKRPGTIRVMKKRILHRLRRGLEDLFEESRS